MIIKEGIDREKGQEFYGGIAESDLIRFRNQAKLFTNSIGSPQTPASSETGLPKDVLVEIYSVTTRGISTTYRIDYYQSDHKAVITTHPFILS